MNRLHPYVRTFTFFFAVCLGLAAAPGAPWLGSVRADGQGRPSAGRAMEGESPADRPDGGSVAGAKDGAKATELAADLDCPGCNLVIVSLTNTRKDHLSIYGGKRPTTPNIDRFFSNAIIFDKAFAPASWTLPVSASLFTSVYPYSHGVMNRYDNNRLADDYLTLAELLKAQGYQTAGFTGGGDYNRKFNVFQGFDTYVDEVNHADYGLGPLLEEAKVGNLAYLGIERLVPLATDWIAKHREEKMFLLLQGYDTHCPFTPKPPFDKMFDPNYDGKMDFSSCLWTFDRTEPVEVDGQRRWPVKTSVLSDGKPGDALMTDRDLEHMLALYDGEIAQADSYLEALFKSLGDPSLAARTIVIFMAEHGDLFGEHGRFMRGGPLHGTFYDPVLNFPLLVKHPKVKGLIRVDAFMESIDFLPTLAAILRIDDPKQADRQGKSMVPFVVAPEKAGAGGKYVFAASHYVACNNVFFSGTSVVEAVRSREWKLTREALYDAATGSRREVKYQLFHLSEDPGEDHDVYSQHREVATELERALRERFPKPPVDETAPPCTEGSSRPDRQQLDRPGASPPGMDQRWPPLPQSRPRFDSQGRPVPPGPWPPSRPGEMPGAPPSGQPSAPAGPPPGALPPGALRGMPPRPAPGDRSGAPLSLPPGVQPGANFPPPPSVPTQPPVPEPPAKDSK